MRQLPPKSIQFTVLLGLIAGLPALSIDLSAPTLAILPVALQTDVFVAGLSLSLFVLGFGLGQFVGGRGSDRLGRRPVLLAALIIYTISGVCCTLATTGGQLATARLLQGVGAGACSVQAYAIIQDLFTGDVARRKQAYVSVVLTLMPMLAPALGAVIMTASGWRTVQATMAAGGGLLMLMVSVFIAESRSERPESRPAGLGLVDSLRMLRDRRFRRISIVNALSYASIFAYVAGAPVVIIAQLGYGNSVYAALFACTAVALSGGAMLSARLAGRVETSSLVWIALVAQALANAGVIIATLIPSPLAQWSIPPLLAAGSFARGIISPNLVHAAISSHRSQAGLAAAIVGLAQLTTASVTSALLARLLDRFGAFGVALTMTILTAVAVALWVATGLGRLIAERS